MFRGRIKGWFKGDIGSSIKFFTVKTWKNFKWSLNKNIFWKMVVIQYDSYCSTGWEGCVIFMISSMLMADVGEKLCWRQVWEDDDRLIGEIQDLDSKYNKWTKLSAGFWYQKSRKHLGHHWWVISRQHNDVIDITSSLRAVFFKFLDFSRNQPQNCYLVMKRDSTKIDNAT